jgi:ABC-type multidrug transport system fused ATPase/permease subunit
MKKGKQGKQENVDLKKFWKDLWVLVSRSRKLIYQALVLTFFIEIIRLIGPYLLKVIIDTLEVSGFEKLNGLLFLILAIFVVYQLISLLTYFSNKVFYRFWAEAELYLAADAHKKMIYLGLTYHQKENTGNKVAKIIRGVDKIVTLLGNFFWEVMPTIFQLVLTMIILFVIDWRFSLMVLFFAPIFILLTFKLNKDIYPARKKRFDEVEVASGMMTQSIININTVKSFVQEKRECRDFYKISNSIKESILREYGKVINVSIARNFVIDIGRISFLLFGVFLVWKGGMTIGSLVFVVTVSDKALSSLHRISRLYDQIMQSSEAVTRLHDLSNEESEIKNPKNGIKAKNISGKISFKNDTTSNLHTVIGKVSFEDEKLLENFNVVIGAIKKAKPSSSKGIYLRSISLCSSMGPGVKVILSE